MWCPVGFRRAYEVLEVAKEHVASAEGFDPESSDSKLAAYELCADALGQTSGLQLAFLDGRIFLACPSILSLFQDDATGVPPGFLFLNVSLEVDNSRLTWLAKHLRRKLFWQSCAPGSAIEGMRRILRLPPGRHFRKYERDLKLYQRAVAYLNYSKNLEGAIVVIPHDAFPGNGRIASLWNARRVEPPSTYKPVRKSGRPAKTMRIAQVLKSMSPDRPLDTTYSEIYDELEALTGMSFSDDTYSRAKRLAWPQTDPDD